MNLINMPRAAWKRQPQRRVRIDWRNPLTTGLHAIVDPITLVDYVALEFATFSGTSLSPSADQVFRKYNGSGDEVVTKITTHAVARTQAIRFRRDGNGGSSLGRIFDKRTAAVNSQAEVLYNRGLDGSTSLGYSRASTGRADYEVTAPASAVTGGKIHGVVITHDTSSIANVPRIWIDGVKLPIVQNADASGSWVTNASAYTLGNRNNDSARGWNGLLGEFFVWDRLLEDFEIVEFYRNQWQLFRADPVITYFIPADVAATIPTLSAPGVIDIGSTSVRPQITLTF